MLLFSQIKEKLLQLTEKRKEMIDKWEDRWEWLRLSKDISWFSSLCSFWVSVESMPVYFPALVDLMGCYHLMMFGILNAPLFNALSHHPC